MIGKIGSYLQIVTKDPSSTAFVPLAEAYRQIGLLDDALEAARLGTQRLPHFSPGFSTMGRILGQMGRLDESMSAYAKALSIDRQSQSALIGLARLHLIRGERDQARKILHQAQEFHPTDEKIADMINALDLPRPWAEIKQAVIPQAPTPAKPATPAEPGEPIATATLAEIYVKQGLLDKAVAVYQGILEQNPENGRARERILQLQQQLGTEAEEHVAESTIDAVPSAFEATVEPEPQNAPPETVREPQGEPKDQSPLAVFQRWLTAIKNGRVHV